MPRTSNASLLTAALDYASQGLPVFPCKLTDKKPYVTNGFHDATCDPAQITAWWQQWPTASIGMPTGRITGRFVLDVDPDKGGQDSLDELVHAYTPLPETSLVLTGGGGKHYHFAMPAVDVRNSQGVLAPGLDIRGTGGYVIVPPSSHASGRNYEWELTSTGLAKAPGWLLALLAAPTPVVHAMPEGIIPEGNRNGHLASVAGKLRRNGLSVAVIAAALHKQNECCQPPLPAKEVEQIATSVGRYAPAEPHGLDPAAVPVEVAPQQTKWSKNAGALALSDTTYGDIFNAETLVLNHGAQLRYCKEWNAWYIWQGTHWGKDRVGAVHDFARETLRALAHWAVDTEDDKLLKHVTRSRSAAGIASMLALARKMEAVRVLPEDFDQHHWLLNCLNGTVNLRTGDIKPHDPGDMLTKRAEASYNPWASCDLWGAFIERIMGVTPIPDDVTDLQYEAMLDDQEPPRALLNFLWRAAGYSLVGSTQEKVLLLPWGSGDNGKSTFIETFAEVLGEGFAMRTPAEMFLSKNAGSIPNEVAALKGVRFAYAAEPPQGRRLDASLIKDLTGGDTVSARFMRGEFFSFRPECTLWMSTNHKPPTRDTGDALWNRIKLIPFTVTIPKAEQDGELRTKLLTEADGILTWAVKGCLAWQRDGLQEPEAIRNATAGYRAENDTVGAFLDEECTLSNDTAVRTQSKEFYTAYKKWAEEASEHVLTHTAFSLALKEKGLTSEKKGKIYWVGIGLAR